MVRLRGLVLASRSGPGAAGAARLAARLAGLGAGTLVAVCDAADRGALAGLLGRLGRGPVPLTGVVHAAGVLDDGVIGSLTPGRVLDVVRPKAAGAWHLHELTEEQTWTGSCCSLRRRGAGQPGAGELRGG